VEVEVVATALAALALAAVHVLARWMTALDRVPRSWWLSAASGVSVAYVLVQLLPEVAEVQRRVEEGGDVLAFLERQAWLFALAGLLVFYGLERHAQRVRRGERGGGTTPDEVGWLHVGSYAAYNALVGFLLVEQVEAGVRHLALFTAAIALHFVVNDHGLREDHGAVYHRAGRWLLAAAVLAGWALGVAVPLDPLAVDLPLAFLAGSIVLTVLKEELPEDRDSRFLPFAAAAAAYAALLVAL
jgi:zinc transporter ZupT